MINIGKVNTLRVVAEYPFGYALAPLVENDDPWSDSEAVTVTLPHDQVSESLAVDSTIDVFVATDQRGDLFATVQPPRILVGETKVLKAVSATHFGAFFDWGLDSDLLVPNDYQDIPIDPGMYYVVHAFFDKKTNRILGATRLHYFLTEGSAYLNEGDTVECLVYSKSDLGFKVVINEKYLGLIFHSDAFKPLKIGEKTDGIIKNIREDGKIDVSLQRQDKAGRSELQQAILDDLEAHGGVSTLTDKSAPDAIYQHFNVSKAAYKKALGALYKQKKITINPDAIRLIK
ncbi:hypothetical protein GTH32_02600 [Alteromonas sp. 345S023]|uniref:GntR family transcriptional regulator n=1 Tax=Alteromonas profundi TaxID=2696062 RepID=A0A7X5LIR9_9ALTE|nr:S1-like domain-containing RNA-binding protein [Alteromonas profundi]NDV90083.1 hypothetical protein [Alteromonas profundi]